MKAIKIYLVVVTVLLVVAIGLGIYVWYKIQTFNAVIPAPGIAPSAQENIQTTTPSTSTPAPITVTTDSLTDTQKKMLETFGYTQDTFTITPAMIQCAEESVGKTRLDEIVGGGAPTPFESMKLLPCFGR